MKEVKKYESIDGLIFDSASECEEHEKIISDVEDAMKDINPVPKDNEFISGNGFVKQDPETVKKAMIRIIEISGIDLEDRKEDFLLNPFRYRYSVIGRILSEGYNNSLDNAWCRFARMDDSYREWGQQYFAHNPNEGKQFEINKKEE